MARPPKWRWVEQVPEITHFKPAGVPRRQLQEVVLTVEELEAMRLKDQEGLDQEACAEKMQVSRPTFHRIITSAREKVARALVEGQGIRIEGGHYRVLARRFRCRACHYRWEEPPGTVPGKDLSCPKCESPAVHRSEGGHRHGPAGE